MKHSELVHEVMFQTVVGSHAWGMQRPDSDKDVYKVYIAPSEDFLIGKTHTRGHENQSDEVDISSFEIGHVINQLKKGNLNHLIGLLSPMIEVTCEEHEVLKEIVLENFGKNCFHSIKGMAYHNYKRYFEDNPRSVLDEKGMKKKLGQVGRVANMGINLLTYNEFKLEPYQPETRYDIIPLIDKLEDALKDSKLPEKPDDKVFDDYLLELRLKRLRSDIYV